MKSIREMVEQMRRGPTDVLGVDVRSSGTPVVRMRKAGSEYHVVAADVLSAVNLRPSAEGGDVAIAPLELPSALRAKYASICLPGENAIIRLLNFPTVAEAESPDKILQSLGLSDPDSYRVSYKVITRAHGKAESRTLAVALPEKEGSLGPRLFPSGLPAPFSLEVGDLATMTAFLHGPAAEEAAEAIGILSFGSDSCALALFHEGVLALVRRFTIGTNTFLDHIRQALGVDRETAAGILLEGSFDVSQSIALACEQLLKQLILSRDFVERREDCHVGRLCLSGELVGSRDVVNEISSALGIQVTPWNPFEKFKTAENAIPAKFAQQPWQFAGAVGACVGTFEET